MNVGADAHIGPMIKLGSILCPHPSRACVGRASYLPHRGRLWRRIATPVCAISWYDCHWQSWIFQIRCAEHHWFAMTRIYKSTSKIYPHPLWNVENLSVDNFTVKIFSTRPVEGCEETHTGLWKKSGCRSKAKWSFPHKLSLILLILP